MTRVLKTAHLFDERPTDQSGRLVLIPIHLRSPANRREYRYARAARVKRERAATRVAMEVANRRDGGLPPLPIRVDLVRLAKRPLDRMGNLQDSFKSLIDELCAWYEIDDSDARFKVDRVLQLRARRSQVEIWIRHNYDLSDGPTPAEPLPGDDGGAMG